MATQERRQLLQSLSQFYTQPIAQVSVELFLSIAAVLFFAVFAIRPTLITMADLVKEIQDKRELDKALSQKIAALSSAQSEYVKLESRFAVLDANIPTNPHLVETLKILEKLASEQKITITGLTLADVPKDAPPDMSFDKLERRNLRFSVTVGGEFPAIRGFVAALMTSQRSFLIERVTFSINDVRGLKRLDASIALAAPYYGPKL